MLLIDKLFLTYAALSIFFLLGSVVFYSLNRKSVFDEPDDYFSEYYMAIIGLVLLTLPIISLGYLVHVIWR